MATVIEGRIECPVCNTDKSWAELLEGNDSPSALVKRMNTVIEPEHQGHIAKLKRGWRQMNGTWQEESNGKA